ncbi:MAG: four-carbon acid sugar kinase family protein [Rhodospirillales bacterium]|nr:four-carbon acid sugar kinase family protein [Rhodospirillales bacterium]
MLEIAVIADDLTGAADTGIQFRPLFADTLLMADTALAAGPDAQALSIHTGTRAATPEQAREKVYSAARDLLAIKPARVYKKVDSCLRGNLGAETDAVVEALGLKFAFIAPAFPEVGRTTANGIHLVHGEPVAETEMGRDPATPVTQSRLADVISAQSRLPVGHIGLETIEAGAEAIAAQVDALAEKGIVLITFDATRQDHLKTIAGLTLDRFPSTLLVGSAGLGQGLRDCMVEAGAKMGGYGNPQRRPGHHLIALGTASAQARRQVETLRGGFDLDLIELSAEDLAAGETGQLASVAARLNETDVIVRIAPPQGEPDREFAGRVALGFGTFVAELLRQSKPASVFLSGGDSAISVLDRLRAKALRLECEISPTLVCGTVVGGEANGMNLGTKPGAMGDDNAMLLWRKFWL